MTVNVVLPLPLDQAYTYRVPEALVGAAQAGARVLVPFRNRRLTGIIVGEGPAAETLDFDVKAVLDVLDDVPVCTEGLLDLTKWIADYYVCPWGEALKAVLPAGTTVETEHRLTRTDAAPDAWADHEVGRTVLEDLAAHGETTLAAVRKRVGPAVPLALIRRMAADDVVAVETTLSDERVAPKTETHLRFAPAFQHKDAPDDLIEQLRGNKQRAVVRALAGFRAEGTPEPRRTDVMERADASYSTVRSLVEKGMLELVEKEVMRSPLDDLPAPDPPPDHDLLPAQQDALDAVTDAVDAHRYGTFLLHGITGSGKTEVYIRALQAVRARGRTGIILVPEIALTPQTVQRFRAHFGDEIAVLHSQMNMGERYDAWRRLRTGEAAIAIGPRSAVLAPLEDLGLIVVDEEHEASYKQFDPAPRYHARDVAVMRAHRADAVCILGSATPSLESTMNARWGKYERLELPERVPDASGKTAALPDVRVLDLALQRKKHQLDGALADPLREAIRTRVDRGEQTILLQNRRGYAPVLECEDCGWAPECQSCSVSLTLHRHGGGEQLRCHYCGYAARVPRQCPECGGRDIHQIGTGTQRVEAELEEVVPDATILRMDRDTTREKHGHHDLLRRFENGADILLGTQMIAKGLDFSRVTLVGVVDADVGLLFPDFRAEERTFQLLTQVAGRAGRTRELAGEVILQTRNPDHMALRYAQEHDYEGFAEEALAERRGLGYPPFGHVATVEFRGPDEDRVERLAENWTEQLRQHAGPAGVMGPEPAFIQRVKKQHRYRTLLKVRGGSPGPLQTALRRTRDAHGAPPNGYHVAVDVDTQDVL
ncbi:replication restart helicase PriA [Salinibacter ruber]|uniref:replication restart helicase PriA n=1 Tax=Salinibacter ruber TaxID=146919 RepID=UPI000E584FAB|nr:primosomal protein N' [Salinibacter ruber]